MAAPPQTPARPARGDDIAGDRGAPLPFGPATRAWFEATFPAPTPVQARGWAQIAAGAHTLLLAPTGSGKTLAAFLAGLDALAHRAEAEEPGWSVVYVSPLKALVHDVERNLRGPLAGIRAAALALGLQPPRVQIDIRTGDTSASERARMLRHPGDILVTTPESLFLILGSAAGAHLRAARVVIVDEIHALAGTKRGAHLALSLERLDALAGRDVQRIGLSATATPVRAVAGYLGGDREVAIVDSRERPQLRVLVADAIEGAEPPVPRKSTAPAALTMPGQTALAARLLPAILARRTTIVFVGARGTSERLAHELNELAEDLARDDATATAGGDGPIALAHHGSLSHARRAEIEDKLKRGAVRVIVATSSLELGIDMGAVDQVICVGSPGRVSAGLQRIGRAGHAVGSVSEGWIVPRPGTDVLESVVVAQQMLLGAIEPVVVPEQVLDVLAQQLVAMTLAGPIPRAELGRIVRRAAGYRTLSDALLDATLDMLSGKLPTTELAELRPLLQWDRASDLLSARPGAAKVSFTHAGTIPDRGLFAVHLGEGGPRVGELDEEMVFESRPGQIIVLGASSWKIEQIGRDRVVVSPAPGQGGTLPFWKGDGPGRPLTLGRAIGAFVREASSHQDAAIAGWVQAHAPVAPAIAAQIAELLIGQREATGVLPSDRTIVVERFVDDLGDLRICILSPHGSRVHAPWAMALEEQLGRETGALVRAIWNDDGIVFTLADLDEDPWRDQPERWLPDPDELDELLVERLGSSALFSGLFRENAARALLLRKRQPGARQPLWAQRLRAQRLLAVARQHPDFPIVLETYRHAMRDVFDLDALRGLLRDARSQAVHVAVVDTERASPMARALAYEVVSTWMYEADAPVAERRAAALSLDRALLADLLGQVELRDLLDAEVIEQLHNELQGLAEGHQATTPEQLLDLLRRVGDLDDDELRARCAVDPTPWLPALQAQFEVVQVELAGQRRWIVGADAARTRDAFGATLPSAPGLALPTALLASSPAPLDDLLRRFARRRGPFQQAALAARFGLRGAAATAALDAAVRALVADGSWVQGALQPGATGLDLCDAAVLRQIRRRSLERARARVAPVDDAVFARFLQRWHGVTTSDAAGPADRPGSGQLDATLRQLEGQPLPASELERRILPARVPGYRPEWLDQRLASGEWMWVGAGALGARDGKICLVRRANLAVHWRAPTAEPDDAVAAALLSTLRQHGACFFFELLGVVQAAASRAGPADAPANRAIPSAAAVAAALWQLVWAGWVSNDSLQPLRTLAATTPRKGTARAGRGGGAAAAQREVSRLAGGRWSLLRALAAPSDEQAGLQLVQTLLQRHGVLSRESLHVEAIAGGWTGLRPLLRAFEERGRAIRGDFVRGLTGSQLATSAAVESLRQAEPGDVTTEAGRPAIVGLAALDPAQPWGRVLRWPSPTPSTVRLAPGATVVLADGAPLLLLSANGSQLQTLASAATFADATLTTAAIVALLRCHGARTLRIEAIDGAPAMSSALRPALASAGFVADGAGMRRAVL